MVEIHTACDDHPPRAPRPRTDGSRRRTADSSRSRLAARRLRRLVLVLVVTGRIRARRLAADDLDGEGPPALDHPREARALPLQRPAAAVAPRPGAGDRGRGRPAVAPP